MLSKKDSAYTQIGARRFKFIDISNYLAGGESYSAFLKAYNIKETKSYFPYEWFDHPSKLDHPCLPDYKEFYSDVRQKNVLEVKLDDDDDRSETEIGAKHYQELKDIWHQQNMTRFEDFLIYYNNLDVKPFVQAVEKMQQFYFDHHFDLFKVAVSVPGISRQWLFKRARDAKISFGLIETRSNKTLLVGPASFLLGMRK